MKEPATLDRAGESRPWRSLSRHERMFAGCVARGRVLESARLEQKGAGMKRWIVFGLVFFVVAGAALATPPKGAVRGTFSVNTFAGDLAKYMRWSNVFCVLDKDHVIVHVSGKNTSAEHVTTTIAPRYYIANGGVHGDGLGSYQDKGFDAGGFRSLWLDAGKPKGVAVKSPISKCAPRLEVIKSG